MDSPSFIYSLFPCSKPPPVMEETCLKRATDRGCFPGTWYSLLKNWQITSKARGACSSVIKENLILTSDRCQAEIREKWIWRKTFEWSGRISREGTERQQLLPNFNAQFVCLQYIRYAITFGNLEIFTVTVQRKFPIICKRFCTAVSQ